MNNLGELSDTCGVTGAGVGGCERGAGGRGARQGAVPLAQPAAGRATQRRLGRQRAPRASGQLIHVVT